MSNAELGLPESAPPEVRHRSVQDLTVEHHRRIAEIERRLRVLFQPEGEVRVDQLPIEMPERITVENAIVRLRRLEVRMESWRYLLEPESPGKQPRLLQVVAALEEVLTAQTKVVLGLQAEIEALRPRPEAT